MDNVSYITKTGAEVEFTPTGRKSRLREETMMKAYAEHIGKIAKKKKDGENDAV